MKDLHAMSQKARDAFWQLSSADHSQRNRALEALSDLLVQKKETVFSANRLDLDAAEKGNLASPLLHRLTFGEEKLKAVTEGLRATAALEDPLNHTLYANEITNGLRLYRVTCPENGYRFHFCVRIRVENEE